MDINLIEATGIIGKKVNLTIQELVSIADLKHRLSEDLVNIKKVPTETEQDIESLFNFLDKLTDGVHSTKEVEETLFSVQEGFKQEFVELP